ncbi:MAG: hypothetical protein ACRDHZ_00110 [Ktedonobacteraceae bacterium]
MTKTSEPKKRLDIRIAADLRDGLDLQAKQSGKSLTAVVEDMLAADLARRQGEIVESGTLPTIRAAVREEVGMQIAELYGKLADDLMKRMSRADNRLAAIGAKGARSAGIAWRLVYALLVSHKSERYAKDAYEDAKVKAGKELAQREENIPGT